MSSPRAFGRIDEAWRHTIDELLGARGGEIEHWQVTVEANGGRLLDDLAERSRLDTFLATQGKKPVLKTAEPIFPRKLWRSGMGSDALFAAHARRARRFYAWKRRLPRGDYFARMVELREGVDNQVRHVIDGLTGGRCTRRSGLTINVQDPGRDMNFCRQSGFPCLQSVQFSRTAAGLHVNGVYPLQYCVTKLYGNLMGLGWLGEFVAASSGLQLARVTCSANWEVLGFSKRTLEALRGLG